MIVKEVYKLRVQPGNGAQFAADRMAKYIVNRYMPGNAGGAPAVIGPQIAKALLPFFQRETVSIVQIDTRLLNPPIAITEWKR